MVLGNCLLSFELRNHDDGLFVYFFWAAQGAVLPVGTQKKFAEDIQAPIS
jgi:hypothetical protein